MWEGNDTMISPVYCPEFPGKETGNSYETEKDFWDGWVKDSTERQRVCIKMWRRIKFYTDRQI